MTRCTVVEPHKAGGWVVAGYIKHRQLPQLEVSLEIIVINSFVTCYKASESSLVLTINFSSEAPATGCSGCTLCTKSGHGRLLLCTGLMIILYTGLMIIIYAQTKHTNEL